MALYCDRKYFTMDEKLVFENIKSMQPRWFSHVMFSIYENMKLSFHEIFLIYVTRPAKINHVGTFKYLRNTNLKYSMLHNSYMPDSSHIRFIQEVQQGDSY